MAEYRFDRFVVEPERRRLLIDGAPAKIGARAFDVLLTLIERRHRLASKQELFEQVWPNVTVEEGNLQVQIFALRKLLGADTIMTIPGHGYQFTTPIEGEVEFPRRQAAALACADGFQDAARQPAVAAATALWAGK